MNGLNADPRLYWPWIARLVQHGAVGVVAFALWEQLLELVALDGWR